MTLPRQRGWARHGEGVHDSFTPVEYVPAVKDSDVLRSHQTCAGVDALRQVLYRFRAGNDGAFAATSYSLSVRGSRQAAVTFENPGTGDV